MPQPEADAGRRVMLPALTAIRGLAAWYVVVFHFRDYVPHGGLSFLPAIWDRGYLAVDLFFVLSGFVVTLNYVTFLNRPGPRLRQALRFLWLRLGRIYPLHITVLVLMLLNPLALLLTSAHGLAGSRYNSGYFVLSVFLVQNWGFARKLAWNVPAWSISTEWFAYLVFPAFAWLIPRARLTAGGWAGVALGLCAAFALAWSALGLKLGADITEGGLLRCVMEFLMGAAVHNAWAARRAGRRALRGDPAVVAALALAAAHALLPLPDHVVMPPCFCLLIYGLADPASRSARLLAGGFLQAAGIVSYSTYLLHFWVRDWVKFVLIHHDGPQPVPTLAYLAAVAALSVVFHRWVELPGRDAFRAAFPTPPAGLSSTAVRTVAPPGG